MQVKVLSGLSGSRENALLLLHQQLALAHGCDSEATCDSRWP